MRGSNSPILERSEYKDASDKRLCDYPQRSNAMKDRRPEGTGQPP